MTNARKVHAPETPANFNIGDWSRCIGNSFHDPPWTELVPAPAPILIEEEKIVASIQLSRRLAAASGVYKKTLMVCRAVAHVYGVRPDDLTGVCRLQRFVRPRHIAMTIAHDLLGYNYAEIGRAFGGRDHTTARHAVNKFHDVVAPLIHLTGEKS